MGGAKAPPVIATTWRPFGLRPFLAQVNGGQVFVQQWLTVRQASSRRHRIDVSMSDVLAYGKPPEFRAENRVEILGCG